MCWQDWRGKVGMKMLINYENVRSWSLTGCREGYVDEIRQG